MAGGPVLVVVDVQNDFCHPEGAVAQRGDDVSDVQKTVERMKDAVRWFREQKLPIIFVRVVNNKWFNTPEWAARRRNRTHERPVPTVQEGSWGAEFYGVEPMPEDLVINKIRYSAFQYTPLEVALRAKEARDFFLIGTQTDVCVEATAMDGLQRGFMPIVIEDCVATPQAGAAEVLDSLRYRGAQVTTLNDAMAAYESTVSAP